MSKKYEDKSSIFNISKQEYLNKKEALTSFFLDKEYVPMTKKQIANILNIKKEERDILSSILNELEIEGTIYIDDSKRYIPFFKTNFIRGIYQAKSERFGFVTQEYDDDIYIESKFNLGAMNGDLVLAKITKESTAGKSKEGEIIKILKRKWHL